MLPCPSHHPGKRSCRAGAWPVDIDAEESDKLLSTDWQRSTYLPQNMEWIAASTLKHYRLPTFATFRLINSSTPLAGAPIVPLQRTRCSADPTPAATSRPTVPQPNVHGWHRRAWRVVKRCSARSQPAGSYNARRGSRAVAGRTDVHLCKADAPSVISTTYSPSVR